MSGIGISTGLKALLSARYALDTIGHNIANANTPGYSRQRVQLGSSSPLQLGRLLIGTGVDIGNVQRSVDELLGRRIQVQRSLLGSLSAQRGGLADLEAFVAEPSENGLGTLMDGFFSSLSQLATAPADPILRTDVIESTDQLTARFRDLASALDSLAGDSLADISSRVDEANGLADQIATLNQKIVETESVGIPANDLRDQRDAALGRLSELVDTTVVGGENGTVRVLVAGNILVGTGGRSNHLAVDSGLGGERRLRIQGASGFVPVQGGEIGGLLRLGTETAPGYRERLDRLARELILEVNRTHTTGVPAGGGFQSLTGSSVLQDFDRDGRVKDELLSNAGLPFDVGTGSLYVNLTDQSTGVTTRHRIDIEASRTTVQDFLDQLNELPGLSAGLDPANRLRISADSGVRFDFSRRLVADADALGLFGGTRPSLSSGLQEPFPLADGDTLDFSVNTTGTPVPFTLTLAAADFADIGSATAEELAAVINADPNARATGLVASAVEGELFLQTQAGGSDASFTLTGGSAVGALGLGAFVGTPVVGQENGVDARFSGTYTGAADEHYVLRPTTDGTIGTTDGLAIQVFDRAGNLVSTLDVGAGYVPGTELDLGNGIRVQFGLGELSATEGDLLAFDAVADSDSSDVLVALGINTLLEGTSAADIALRAGVADDPTQLAISLTGEDGDGDLLLDFLAIEKHAAADLGGVSVGRFWGDLAADVGFDASLTDSAMAASDGVLQSLEERRLAISGVNVDEELVDLVAYQQSFAAAAQYLSVVNQLGDDLLSLL